MNGTMMQKTMEVVQLTSVMASPIEIWRDQWYRNGKLQLLSHPKTNRIYLISKTIRTMKDTERTMRMDLWEKVQRHYPRITLNSFREVFDGLINQAYYGLKEDLIYYAEGREEKMHK